MGKSGTESLHTPTAGAQKLRAGNLTEKTLEPCLSVVWLGVAAAVQVAVSTSSSHTSQTMALCSAKQQPAHNGCFVWEHIADITWFDSVVWAAFVGGNHVENQW